MWFEMREVGLDFLERAGKTYVMECDLEASRPDVWRAFTDPSTWRHWFPGVESASYGNSPEPYGVGTFREATVSGQKYEEVIVAWDEGKRWAYTIARATVPIAKAQLECTEFEDCGAGTRVRWILAADRRLLLWLAAPVFHRYLRGLFRRAMSNLDAYIRSRRQATAQ